MKKIIFSLLILMICTACSATDKQELLSTLPADFQNRIMYMTNDVKYANHISCHGVAMDEHTILTAEHCIDRKDRRKLVFGAPSGQLFQLKNLQVLYEDKFADLAIIRTDRAIKNINGALPYAKLNIRNARYKAALLNFKYRQICGINGGGELTMRSGSEITKNVSSMLYTSCDVQPGYSGSPLFVSMEGQWKLAGIAIGSCDKRRAHCTDIFVRSFATSMFNMPEAIEGQLQAQK